MLGIYRKGLVAALYATFLCLAGPVLAQDDTSQDRIVLKNGSTVFGTVTGSKGGVISVDTDFAGTLAIAQDQVVSLQSSKPMVLQLADGTVLEAQPLTVQNEQLVVTGTVPGTTFSLVDLTRTDPEPWELGYGYNWTGLVNFAFQVQRGNTDTDELDYKLDTKWRSVDDRYTLRMDGELDKANSIKNADNWTVLGKYDRFLEDRWYWGMNLSVEQDEFADLDLRYYVGPYMGREFYTDPLFMLEAEAGLAYVNEDFIVAEDNEYPGANWNLKMSSNYLGGDSRMYIDHLGIWNLDETSDVILNTTFGLAFPLLFGFEAAAEVLLEYDSGAVEGVQELQETYKLRIGYGW